MRKQLMLLTALLLISCPIFAQDEDSGESSSGGMADSRDPGKLLIEFAANPFSSNGVMSTSILEIEDIGLRARYRLNDMLTTRLTVRMDMENDQEMPNTVVNSSWYDIRPGVEYTLTEEDNFRAYAALDVAILQQFSSYKSSTSPTILGATGISNINDPTNSEVDDRGYFGIGGALSAGAEYHFKKSRFYIGAEIGLQYLYFMYDEVYLEGVLVQEQTTRNTAGLNLSNSLRIGFKLF